MDQPSADPENLTEPLNPESAAAILDEVIASVDLGLEAGPDSLNLNKEDVDSACPALNEPDTAMEVDQSTDTAETINNPVATNNVLPELEPMETDATGRVADDVCEKSVQNVDELSKERLDIGLPSSVSVLQEESLKLSDTEVSEIIQSEQEHMEIDSRSESVTDKVDAVGDKIIDSEDQTDSTEIKEESAGSKIAEEHSTETNENQTVGDQKETNDSSQGSPDNTEFVTTEGDDKNDTVIENTDDPIAGETNEPNPNEKPDSEESILPDTEMTPETNKDDDQEHIVTKTNEQSAKECMHCNKSETPKYSCKVGEKNLYLCNEDCLKSLKEKKSRVIVRDLRVKTFAVVDPSAFIEETTNKCHSCKTSLDGTVFYNWNVMNFCCSQCLANYQKQLSTVCVQCSGDVPSTLIGKYSVRFGLEIKQFCKNSCLLDHKRCGMRFCYLCQAAVPTEVSQAGYCSKTCHEVSKGVKKHGICSVCNKDTVHEIRYDNGSIIIGFCGYHCFVAYTFVNSINPTLCEFCKVGKDLTELPYGFWMFGKRYQFCTEECQKLYIATTRKIVHCKTCNVKKYDFDMVAIMNGADKMTVCSLNCYNLLNMNSKNTKNVCDLCRKNIKPQFYLRTLDNVVHNFCTADCLKIFKDHLNKTNSEQIPEEDATPGSPLPQKIKKIVVVRPREIPPQRNVATMCKPNMNTKAISCKPRQATISCQTDSFSNKFLIPIPVPVFVPIPLPMFSQVVPTPFPIPIPIPVPIFIPTTRNSAKGIMKEIQKIRNKTPANPLEAEILLMAEMVAEDKKDPSDSESDNETRKLKPETSSVETNNFGEDVIQMALKMAGDFDDPSDLEVKTEDSTQRIESIMETKRRNIRQARQGKISEPSSDGEKPDANMSLKYTFGVNAWKQWVTTKNLELQKTTKKPKLFKTEILHLTADELNFSLCLFVKEVRKPNGAEYAPDTIYYLCLGIQQYLYENSRIDNIFCDPFYDKFTDCLNEVCQKFSVLYNESQYIVTRVEEEHLWEAKQLGAHSPLVLLNTLMFFNTKHFSLTTVGEHLQLSFSHIMKHWKRNPHQPGSRNVLLRFYPPQSADGTRKKKVYEQHENDENPIRCPVKLYEFYLSKCPESVKTRNDVFYLQPERSCVPDSPVWYSTMPQEQEPLEKMLNRVKMVKEINIAILTT